MACVTIPVPTLRVNLTPTPREKRTRSRTQQATERDSASKRQCLEESSVSSHAAGFIQISDVDPDGKFVQIKNMSNQVSVQKPRRFAGWLPSAMGKWQLIVVTVSLVF